MKKNRIIYLYILAMFAIVILISRMAWIQIVNADKYEELAKENTIRKIPVKANRGDIYSSDGQILVKNSIYFKLSLLSFEIESAPAVLSAINKIVPLSPSRRKTVLSALSQNTMEPVLVKDMLDYDTFCRLSEIRADYNGIYLEVVPVRDYPLATFACHCLGYDGLITEEELKLRNKNEYAPGDNIGKDGLEKFYDKLLRGRKGASRIQVDVRGRMVSSVGTIFPETGDNLVLTIDSRLQKVCEKELKSAVESIEAVNGESSGGAAVVLDINTGEVLAMASFPVYNPNYFSHGITNKQYNEIISNRATPLLNRVIHGAYPCASTFKLITTSAALEEKLAGPNGYFYCPGNFNLDGHIFNCFVTSGHGTISFNDAIAYSCDVVYYMLAVKFDLNRFLMYIHQFGLGNRLGIDLPGENPGLVPSPEWKKKVYKEDWYPGDTVNLSIGQGFVEVTPLQVASFTSAVANGGFLYKPFVVKYVVTADGKILKKVEPVVVHKVPVSAANFEMVRKGMRSAVLYGTAKAANSEKIAIAGKTGTAENFPTPENPFGRNHTWFTSFAPYEKPEIAVTVFLEKSGGFGGERTSVVARKIYEEYAASKK